MRWAAMVLGLATVLEAAPAFGGGIALESRSQDTGDLLAPVARALTAAGFQAGGALALRIERDLSQPASQVSGEHLVTARRLVERARELGKAKRWAEVIRLLPVAVDVYRAQPSALAGDDDQRGLAFSALALLARAQLEVGNRDQALALTRELVSWFPDRRVDGALKPLADEAGTGLRAAGTGRLSVSVSRPGAEIFINERPAGAGKAAVELPAGRYRVLARADGRAGRVHMVELSAGGDGQLEIDWQLDAAVQTARGTAALEFADEAVRTAHEKPIGLAVARRLRADSLVLYGLRGDGEARWIVATAFDTRRGELVRAARIAVEPVGSLAERAKALAGYLAGGTGGALIEPLGQVGGSAVALHPQPRTDRPSRAHWWYWGAAGTGGVLAASGVVLWMMDGDGTCELEPDQRQCPDVYATRGLGIATLAAGLVLAGGGTYLALTRAPRSREQRSLAVSPTSGGGWSLLLRGQF